METTLLKIGNRMLHNAQNQLRIIGNLEFGTLQELDTPHPNREFFKLATYCTVVNSEAIATVITVEYEYLE